jgi:hypothetical protein
MLFFQTYVGGVNFYAKLHRINRPKTGFNVIELLILTTVIGVTLMLLLPVLQHTRETARRMQCYNNIKQLALACHEHEATLHYFPSGGWPGPSYWHGDPNLGFGKKQPGGWTYTILPFMEYQFLHDMGLNASGGNKKALLAQAAQTTVSEYYCPSRRQPVLCSSPSSSSPQYVNMNAVVRGARTDYAANGRLDSGRGVIYADSFTTLKDIRDGLSHTYLLGEKNLWAGQYLDGTSLGDSLPVYGNSFWDWERTGDVPPAKDQRGHDYYTAFGSAHPIGFNMSFCDGSACIIKYDIDPVMHKRLSDRRDGQAAIIP